MVVELVVGMAAVELAADMVVVNPVADSVAA